MSCCKVKIEKNDKVVKKTYLKNILDNFIALVASIAVITLGLPILYLLCLYFILTSFIFKKDNTIGDAVKVLKNALFKLYGLGKETNEENLADLEDLIKNPEQYKIFGLDETTTNKD